MAADVETINAGSSDIFKMVKRGEVDNVGQYFKSGGDPNVKKRDGLTLAHQAVCSKNVDMVVCIH